MSNATKSDIRAVNKALKAVLKELDKQDLSFDRFDARFKELEVGMNQLIGVRFKELCRRRLQQMKRSKSKK